MFKRPIVIANALFSTYYAYMLEYRAEIIFWALSGSLPLILMGVWMKAATSGQFSLSPIDFARYFLAAFFVRQMNAVWVIWEVEIDILQGKLSPRLLQPLDPAWHYFMAHLAERISRLPFVIGLFVLFFALYPAAFWIPSAVNFWLGMLAIALSFILRFLIQYTFAAIAFWLEQASAIEQFWTLLYLFLSGVIAPLAMFPPQLQDILRFTPFPYLVNFPAVILVGMPVNIGQGLLIMLWWTGIFLVINRWLWRQGLKKYSGMGA